MTLMVWVLLVLLLYLGGHGRVYQGELIALVVLLVLSFWFARDRSSP